MSGIRKLQTSLTDKVFLITVIAFFLSTLTTSLGGVIDSFIVGSTMTSAEVGALSLVSPLWYFSALLYNTLSSGCKPVCANELSKGSKEKARQIFSATLVAGLAVTLFLVVFTLVFRDTVTQLLGAKPGMPFGVSRLTASCKAFYLNYIFTSTVTVAVLAAYNVQVQINYVTNALFMGVAQALSLLVCFYYAEENREGIRNTVRIALPEAASV